MHLLGASGSIAMSCDGLGNSFLSLVYACRQKCMRCRSLQPPQSHILFPNVAVLTYFCCVSHPPQIPQCCFKVFLLPIPPSPHIPTLLQSTSPNIVLSFLCYLSHPHQTPHYCFTSFCYTSPQYHNIVLMCVSLLPLPPTLIPHYCFEVCLLPIPPTPNPPTSF